MAIPKEVKITYRRKDILTKAGGTGSLTTVPSNLPVSDGKIFNSQGGTGYITGTDGLLYEFIYSGVSGNTITGARLKEGSMNYDTNSDVYPIFEIFPDVLKLRACNSSFIPDQTWVKIYVTGEKKGKLRGFYFRAELVYERVDKAEVEKLVVLFDRFVDQIYFYPNKDLSERYRVVVVEPNVLEPENWVLYGNFRVVFESIIRYDHGYYLVSNYWGTRDVTFNDRTPRTVDNKSWYDLMNLFNTNDGNINNSVNQFRQNFEAHLSDQTAHNTLYYTESEIDERLNLYPILYLLYVTERLEGSFERWCGDNSGVLLPKDNIAGYNWKFQPVIIKNGTLVRIAFKIEGANAFSDLLNISVKAGDIFNVLIEPWSVVNNQISFSFELWVNGNRVYSNSFLVDVSTNPHNCVVALWQI